MNEIRQGDWIDVLRTLPDESVNCCITSPPYWGLRDYGHDGQLGLEQTPEEYVKKMVDGFHEVRRVLKNEGTLWLNLGDSYAGNNSRASNGGRAGFGTKREGVFTKKGEGLKPKDLVGIPWMVAFALRADGWYLRQDIIWSKGNPMPESVTDRCTKSHEYIFLLSKSKKYYYDHEAIKTEGKESTQKRLNQDIENQKGSMRANGGRKLNGSMRAVGKRLDKQRGHSRRHAGFNDRWDQMTYEEQCSMGANKRSVWEIPTKGVSDAHFAVYPQELIVDMIKAGCPEGGIVIDPFIGSGTTGIVSRKLNRNYIGIELNPDNIKICEKRIHQELGMFN